MPVTVYTSSFNGIDGMIIEVEVDIKRGLPSFCIVGYGDTSVREAKERVRSAILNCGYEFPLGRITVNLAPAEIRKEGAMFDLAIAVGIIVASEQIIADDIEKYVFLGELSLNGVLKPIKGILATIISGMSNGMFKYIIPLENLEEAIYVEKSEIFALNTLQEVISFLNFKDLLPYMNKEYVMVENNGKLDYSDVVEQNAAKRALEVAAAGNHNILMYGEPGSGKSMLAKRITSILPSLSYEESIEVTKIYSIMGLTNKSGMIRERPFRSPHHSITSSALIGGGMKAKPGEVTLAHNGVLFLDEILEFDRKKLELMRQPLEDRIISVDRKYNSVKYPANFMLVAAMNPCQCGYYGSEKRHCRCSEREVDKYLNKLSGPMLDRFDLIINVKGKNLYSKDDNRKEESSKDILERVVATRTIQRKRLESLDIKTNSEIELKHIDEVCKVSEKAREYMKIMYDEYAMSNRVYIKIIRVARTIADLGGNDEISYRDLIEAIQYRKFIGGKVI